MADTLPASLLVLGVGLLVALLLWPAADSGIDAAPQADRFGGAVPAGLVGGGPGEPDVDASAAGTSDIESEHELDSRDRLEWEPELSPGWLTVTGRLVGAWDLPASVRFTRVDDPRPGIRYRFLDKRRAIERNAEVEGRAFRVDGLVPGSYDVWVGNGPGEPGARARQVTIWRDTKGLELRSTAFEERRCVLHGQLDVAPPLDPNAAFVDITVSSGGLHYHDGHIDSWLEGRQASGDVGPDGRFEFRDLPAGPAVLRVWFGRGDGADAYGPTFDVDVRPETTFRAEIAAPVDLYVRLTATPETAGRLGTASIRRPDGHKRSWSIRVDDQGALYRVGGTEILGRGWVRSERGNRDGHVVLGGLRPGPCELVVEVPGFARLVREIVLEAPRAVLDVSLERAAGRWVRVETEATTWWLEARRTDVGGDWFEALWADETIFWRFQTHPSDIFLAEGRYTFRMRSTDHPPATWGPVEVEDSPRHLVLTPSLGEGASLGGTVRAPDVRWLEGVLLGLLRAEGDAWTALPHRHAEIQSARFAFTGLPPARYRVVPYGETEPVLAEVAVGREDVEEEIVSDTKLGR